VVLWSLSTCALGPGAEDLLLPMAQMRRRRDRARGIHVEAAIEEEGQARADSLTSAPRP